MKPRDKIFVAILILAGLALILTFILTGGGAYL